ncbi:hypothetical protein O181_066469 [Austropuccinia psidii MF-1]|uniref:Uncharacterized protein n=1 Tax=Austropuccinia psidii MF-1 TaxID=1389203 RepID=A0A9Q3ET34_9BASI|nr:hypothetical protein [Austropuccinia psidii MF-1]
MLLTRSGASYNPSSSSQKGYRCDSGRNQSVTEGQGSVNGSQTDKLCHLEADNAFLPSNRADTATGSLGGHLKTQPEGIQQCIAAKEYQILEDLCNSCMNSYLAVRKFLGHTNT